MPKKPFVQGNEEPTTLERIAVSLESMADSAESVADCVRSICEDVSKWLKKRGAK